MKVQWFSEYKIVKRSRNIITVIFKSVLALNIMNCSLDKYK